MNSVAEEKSADSTVINMGDGDDNKSAPFATTNASQILCGISMLLLFMVSVVMLVAGAKLALYYCDSMESFCTELPELRKYATREAHLNISLGVAMLIACITGFVSLLSGKCRKCPYLLWTNIVLFSLIIVGLSVSLGFWLYIFGHGFTPAIFGICLGLCTMPIYVNTSFIKEKVTEPHVPTGTIIVSVLCGLIYLSFFLLSICLCVFAAIFFVYDTNAIISKIDENEQIPTFIQELISNTNKYLQPIIVIV